MTTYETVDTVSASRAAVGRLEREPYIAVDSEGVHLSKTGPLTLLQVGTASGRVFLFDVLREPRMFKDGGLKRLLEGEHIVKVLHSARNDAEALHAQHGVQLHNVHDTQLAHMEVDRAGGRTFPPRLRLEDLCELYSPQKAAMLREGKDSIQTKWNKTEGEYWAKRPLTQEMIQYAANDVIAIVPEVYMAQKQLLEEKRLTRLFQTRVEQDLRLRQDPRAQEEANKEERELIHTTLRRFSDTASRHTQLQDIADDNVLDALNRLRRDDILTFGLPKFIRDLKLQIMMGKVDVIETELQEKGADFEPNSGVCGLLHAYITYLPEEEGPTKRRAEELQRRVNEIMMEDIKRKYTVNTPVTHVPSHEKRALSRGLRPKGEHDPALHPVHLHLHWLVKQEELDEKVEWFRTDPIGFKVNEGYVKVLKFYLSSPDVPMRLKEKGKQFLYELQDAGKIVRSQGGGARGGRGGGASRGRY